MSAVYALYFLSLFSVSSVLCAGEPLSAAIVVYAFDESSIDQIDHHITQPFVLDKLTFTSDVLIQDKEFLYLVDMQEGHMVGVDDIKKAVAYLIKKRKFEKIELQLRDTSQGVHVHFNLVGVWTFQKLKVQGVWVGKDFYRRQYMIEPGDPFDTRRHELSLEKIRESCRRDGNLACVVESTLEKDTTTKAINATISIYKGRKFQVRHVDLTMHGKIGSSHDKMAELQEKIYKKFLQPLAGNSYTKSAINKQTSLFKRYLSQAGFLQVSIQLNERIDYEHRVVDLEFIVELNQKKEFVFVGNTFFSNTQLLDIILEFGRSAWLLPVTILSEELMRIYREKGFWQVHIEAQEEVGKYLFVITQGPRATIKRVVFNNMSLSDSNQLSKRFFKELLKKRFFDETLLKRSMNRLLTEYNNQGFLEAQILKKDFEKLEDGHGYQLTITLDEGERSYIKDITIEGFDDWLMRGPFAVIKDMPEAPFDAVLVEQQRTWLTRQAKKIGYTNAKVKLLTRRDGAAVTLNWKVFEDRSTLTFGKTVLVGSVAFPFEYLVRELQYQAGEPWGQEKIKQSLLRLKALDVFDRIHLYPAPGVASQGERVILLKVHKDDPFELRLRGGIGAQQIAREFSFAGMTYKAGGTFLVKNPSNTGDLCGVDADFTRGFRKFAAYYQRPWLGNLPVRTTVKGYDNKYQQPGFIGSTRNVYEVTQQGVLVSMRYEQIHCDAGGSIGVEWMRTDINRDDPDLPALERSIARAINFESDLVDKKIPYFLLEPTVVVDYLDHKINPTRGTFTVFSLKGMLPLRRKYTDAYFIKVLFEQSLFVPLWSAVGALRVRLGHIFHQDFRAIMPNERFYLGGANSLRGYETDLAPPLGAFVDEKNRIQYVPQGGKSMVNANLELRFPVYKDLSAVVFQDVGALSSGKFSDFKLSAILASSGVGVRYNTPIGPLRFDIGWKWHKDPTDTSYAWFLTIGHAF